MQTLLNDTLIDSKNIANIEYHFESKNFDLRFLSITVDPYRQYNQTNKIQIACHFNDQSDPLIEHCFKFVDFCEGGWVVSDNLCLVGHIGGFCEECDMYDIRGQGNYLKNQLNTSCQDCKDAINSEFPFVLTSIFYCIQI
ncbi:unnamed protein product [Paramecium pentaurelia]|uniref:Uncharacterized protein n=1 Tax=Paramecium pentaurelia TaxID=43138 RepID=A0A8S1XLN9_9CILI|nr:unnamed protein product [Paramecium pentaurelia]